MIILPRTEFRAASDDGSVYEVPRRATVGRFADVADRPKTQNRRRPQRDASDAPTTQNGIFIARCFSIREPQSRRAYSRPLSVGGRGTKARHAPAEQAQQRRPYRVQSSSAPPVGPEPAGADGAQMPAVLFQFTRTITETGNHRGDVGRCITAVWLAGSNMWSRLTLPVENKGRKEI